MLQSLWRWGVVCACVFAMAVGARESWAATRTWMGGDGEWLDNGNASAWTVNDEPDPDDDVVFNSNNMVTMGSSNAVLSLTMSGGIDLETNDFSLDVDGLVELSGNNTILFIQGMPSSVTADDVTINTGSRVELTGGTLVADDEGVLATGIVNIAGGSLVGHGNVNLLDGPLVVGPVLNNNGTISAITRTVLVGQPPAANTLSITANAGSARIDLDGAGESGIVTVQRNQTLQINGTLSDVFNGLLTMAQNSTLDMSQPWTLGAGAVLDINNGSVIGIPGIPAGTATIAGAALTQGSGTIDISDNDGTLIFDAPFTMTGGVLNNNGHVVFRSSSTIGVANLDLDSGEWTVQDNAALTLVIGDYDPGVAPKAFDSEITLDNGDISLSTGDPSFVMNGTLNLSSTSGITVWNGDPIEIGNDGGGDALINVTGSEFSRFAAAVTFKADAAVNVAAGATLDFVDTVNFDSVNGGNSAEFTGAGRLSFNGAVNVNEETTIEMPEGTVDLDGTDNSGNLIVIAAPLEISAQTIPGFGRNNVSGGANRITIDGLNGTGSLTIASPDGFTLNPEGEISILGSNIPEIQLSGGPMNLNGVVAMTGAVAVAARLRIGGSMHLNGAGTRLLLLSGSSLDPNLMTGGVVSGEGRLAALNGVALAGFGTINSDVEFEGTAQLLADDGTLVLGGNIIDAGTLGTADTDGVLEVVNPWNSSTVNLVSLKGGELTGGTLTVGNPLGIRGEGLVSAKVIVNSQLAAVSGLLVIDNPQSDNDWDGAGNVGQLNAALQGTLELRDDGLIPFGGSVNATGGSTVFTNGFGFGMSAGSTLNLSSSTYQSTVSTDIGGTLHVAAGGESTIMVQQNTFLDFESTSSTTLDSNLRLINNNIRFADGATFSGNGAIVIPDGSHATMDAGAEVGVLVNNQGALRPAGFNSVGRVDVKDYQQSESGELYVEIFGTGLNEFDRLVVDGDAVLDGYLNIDIDPPFIPSLGNAFNIISANAISGTFDFVDISGMPPGLTFHLNYLANAVQLQVVNTPIFSADFDDDGDVDATDYKIWRNAFHLNQLGDATGDNQSTAQDYVLWRNQFGSVPASGAGTSPAVPEPAAFLLLLLGLMSAPGTRRRERDQ